MAYHFEMQGPLLIGSSTGHSVEILGRAGLRFHGEGEVIDIDSEMSVTEGNALLLDPLSIPNDAILSREQILEEVLAALKFARFAVMMP